MKKEKELKNMKKIIILALLTILLAGCGSNSKVNALTLEEAQDIAVAEVEGKKVLKAKQDYDDGITYYDFTIVTDSEKYEIEVDANSGTILKKERDKNYVSDTTTESNVTPIDNNDTTTNTTQNTDPATNQTTNNIISAEEAQNIALNKTGGGYLVKSELDHDDHILVYEIEIKNGHYEYEIDINASTGEILKYEQDYHD